jgi:hypothetical protein
MAVLISEDADMSPHEYFSTLDEAGKTYRIHCIIASGDVHAECEGVWDVLMHNENWLMLRQVGNNAPIFVNLENILTFAFKVDEEV